MIAKLLALAVLAAPLAPATAPAQAPAQDPAAIKVISYNIRYDNPSDGPDAWPNRRDDMVAWLREQNADIIGLQEALRRQLDDLTVLGYGEVGVGRDDGQTRGEYAAILYRRDRITLLESGTFWFSDTPDVPGSRSWGNNVTRICTWARFRGPSGSFYVFNVHLDHESQPSRERSVAALLAAVGERRHRADPVIVTGDFNAGPDNPAVDRVRSGGFADAHAALGEQGTFTGFRDTATGVRIDFIFISPELTIESATIEAPRTAAGRQLSDHFPVVAAISTTHDPRPTTLEALEVSATRSSRRIEDQALRVEVVEPEEVEEKLAMTPGDISMLLNETGGLRVASTGPALGNSNVRIHGLRGRYTGILADGLPLYGEAGSLSIMQIPPMDLLQVEIVKGPASAMYGGAALGGLINLVSRRPLERSRELLLNQTSRNGRDAVLFAAQPLGGPWGATLLAGGHTQTLADVDDDGWIDIPEYRRGVVRPRLHYQDGNGRRLFATAGMMIEDRTGGMRDGRPAPDGGPWTESLDTRRFDAGVSATIPTATFTWSARASAMTAGHEQRFGAVFDPDRHSNALLEITASRGDFLAGAAFTFDQFRSDSVARLNYHHVAPALFVQLDALRSPLFALQISARADFHSVYGTQLSPRLSLLWRLPGERSLRLSAARGFFAPTPFVEAADAVGLRNLRVPSPLRAEHANVFSLDLASPLGPLETNVTLFTAHIEDPVMDGPIFGLPGDPQDFAVMNGLSTTAAGADIVARYAEEPWHVTASWTYAWVREELCSGCEAEAALNPRHTAGLVAAWEGEPWRIGGEVYVTGRQRLEFNPERATSPAYTIVGLLVQRRFGSMLLFLNLENLTDARVTRSHSLLLPARTARAGWTTEVWGPLEGRVINGGIRLSL